MFDQNWKTWLLMIVAVMGLSFELLKHLPSEESKSWTTENLRLADNKPYSVHDVAKAPALLPARKKAPDMDAKILQHELQKFVAASQPTKTEFDKKTLDAKAAKKKTDDEWEEVIDPKTGKKVRRKKKKDEKKEEKKEDVAKTKVAPPLPPPPAKDDIGAALEAAVATGGLPTAAPGVSKNTSPFKSLEEWERLLLAHPDLTETRIFLRDFQANLVTADIFYKISQLMVADSRLEMKQLGVLCLGTTPSVLSFQLLAGVQKQERVGSAERSQVEALLNQYGTLNRLPLLEKVLQGSDTYSQTVAALTLDSAAKQLLATPNPNPNGPTAQNVPPANASRFQPFLTVLQGLSQSRDGALASQARQTVTDLQTLLGTTSVASTQTP